MNRYRGFIAATALVLLMAAIPVSSASADANRSFEDESIYDLLVDRFNNGNYNNDTDVNTNDANAFNGGDFAGISNRLQHIIEMGFTTVSLGPVFATKTYDGSEVLDYESLEPRFGTTEEFTSMLEQMHDNDINAIVDFPLNEVSEDHIWAQENKLQTVSAGEGIVNWDAKADSAVMPALKDAMLQFIDTYDVDGIRLTKISEYETAVLNELIAAMKQAKPELYVIAAEESDANFDSVPNREEMQALRNSFIKFGTDAVSLTPFTEKDQSQIIQLDELTGSRFTYDAVEARMFPPTRWKLASAALFTLPGVPMMPYGSEIAVNGEKPPESHQLMNFKTDMELKDYIGDLNQLRNQSKTLRTGDFEMLHNEEGFIVYKISSSDETWIVALNNADKTSNMTIPKEVIGEKKVLRGLVDGDLIRESDDGLFRVVLEREVAEIYIASEDKGFNTPYLIASILVYVLFMAFLISIWRKGKRAKKDAS